MDGLKKVGRWTQRERGGQGEGEREREFYLDEILSVMSILYEVKVTFNIWLFHRIEKAILLFLGSSVISNPVELV